MSARLIASSIVGAAIVLWLAACKSGTTSPSESPTYMPMKEGNYWVYQTYQLDSSGNRTNDPPTRDSAVVGPKTTKDGRECYPVYKHHSTGYTDTTYYAVDAQGNLYEYVELGQLAEGIYLSSRWVLIASAQSTWTVLDTTFTNVQIPNTQLTTTVQVKITGKQQGSEQLTIGGKSYTAQTFVLELVIAAPNVNSPSLGKVSVTRTSSYIANIGLGKYREFTSSSVLGQVEASGSESVLVSYLLK